MRARARGDRSRHERSARVQRRLRARGHARRPASAGSRGSRTSRRTRSALGLTHEFIGRADGFPGLAAAYGLARADVRGIQHELAYEALATGKVDVIDIYTTDAQIEHLRSRGSRGRPRILPALRRGVALPAGSRRKRAGRARAMQALAGRIDEAAMTRANARVVMRRSRIRRPRRRCSSGARECDPATGAARGR